MDIIFIVLVHLHNSVGNYILTYSVLRQTVIQKHSTYNENKNKINGKKDLCHAPFCHLEL